ncbi:MAG TPA: hypothetical protein VI300_27220, partial [Solirubrobacter sp.]
SVSTYFGSAPTTVKVLLNTTAQLPVEIVDQFGTVLGSGVNVATASLSGMTYMYNTYVHVSPPPGGACGVTYDLSIVTESAPSITISPPSAVVQVNGTQYFSAIVNGINAGGGPGTSSVTWTLSDPKCGTLSPYMAPNGIQYTAPAQAVLGCQLTATSTVDPTVSATASIAIGAQNVTGAVSYAGTKKGRVYLTYAWGATGPTAGAVAGTSLDAPGPFTIRGVPGTGTATVMAWIDTLGIGRYVSGADPFGWVTLTGGLDAGTIALADPAVATAPPMPQGPNASAGNAAASVRFTPPRDGSGFEIADHFNVYWSTTPSPGPTNNAGVFQVAAGANRARLKGLTNGDALYFGVSAVAGGQESAVASTTTPITIGIPAEPNHITGTVNFPAAALPGRLVVSATDTTTNVSYSTGVLDPAGSAWTYDVQVPDGTYNMTAYIDRGDDGYFGPTDLLRLGTFAPPVTVSGTTTATGPTIDIFPDNASAFITTTSNGNGSSYTVNVVVRSNLKLPVAATITGGPNVATIDLGLQSNATNFGNATQLGTFIGRTTPPMVGDTYQVSVLYADGTSETLAPSVTGVLTSSPTPMSPLGTAASSTPTFSWSPPAMNGAASYAVYLYRPNTSGGNSQIWSASGIPGTVTNFTYNGAPLASGSYAWSVRANDANNNGATSNLVTFSIP